MSFHRWLVVCAAAVLLSSPTANANAKKASTPQLELIDVFTNTGQALVYDRVEAEYRLLRSGAQIRGFKVGAVASGKLELFRTSDARLRFVITKAQTNSESPIDPYADASATTTPKPTGPATEVMDPWADEPAPGPAKINRVRAPESSRPKAAVSRAIVTRKELDRALDDLDALSREIDLEIDKNGTRVTAIGDGTLPYRLGLRRHDVVVSVAGIKTKRLEDGADVYVKLSSAKKFTIKLLRDKQLISIPVVVQSSSFPGQIQ